MTTLTADDRLTLARTTTDRDALRDLLTNHDWMVRVAAARNPNIDPTMLEGLVERRDCAPVMCAVASNPSTTVDALEGLLPQTSRACDDDGTCTFLCGIAEHPNLSFRLQVQMSDTLDNWNRVADDADYHWDGDDNIRVWFHLVKNPSLDSDILKRIAISNASYAPTDEAAAALAGRGISVDELDADAVWDVLNDRYYG